MFNFWLKRSKSKLKCAILLSRTFSHEKGVKEGKVYPKQTNDDWIYKISNEKLSSVKLSQNIVIGTKRRNVEQIKWWWVNIHTPDVAQEFKIVVQVAWISHVIIKSIFEIFTLKF